MTDNITKSKDTTLALALKLTLEQIRLSKQTHKSPVKNSSISTSQNIQFNSVIISQKKEFFKAIYDYDLNTIKELINHNALDINMVDKFGKTALQYAIIKDKPELAKLLIDAGANINVKTRSGRNLFALAMYNRCSHETFLLLLREDININAMPLKILSRLFNELYPILLESKNDINTPIGKFKRTLLHHAAECSNLQKVQVLISHNINVQAQDITGATALHMAGTPKLAKILLKAGANIESKNNLGRTPLHTAILYTNRPQVNMKNNYGVILQLIKSGADLNAIDYYGFTPIEYAIHTNNPKIFKLLIKNKAKFKENQYELFCQALEKGNFTATKYLFKKDFLNKIDDKNGQNYLYHAAIGGNKEILEYLIKDKHITEEKVLSKFIDTKNNTPIHIAIQNGNIGIVESFQKLGFDINTRNKEGETVLHIAGKSHNGELIKKLITLGADINIKNKIGETALDIVEEDFKNTNKKLSNKELQELFKESNIIARTGRIEDETKYLYQYHQDGEYKNVERAGNRGRSATLLVPDANISLFHTGIGLLYNANESTIRYFMPHDFWTDNARRTDDFFNMKIDIKKFVQTQSKEKFLETYRHFLKDNPQKDYNEIIANLYPKGLIGIALQEDDLQHKVYALASKYYVSEKYNMDLPMTIVKDKQLIPWDPTITEIKKLLQEAKVKVEYYPNYGFTHEGEELISFNKNEVTYNEVKKYFDSTDCNNTENNLHKLLNLVNERLQNDNLPTINNLKDFIIHKQDIKNLMNANFPELNKYAIEEKAETTLLYIQNLRPNKDSFTRLEKYKSIEDILSKELAEERRIPIIINNLKELLQDEIIENLRQTQNYKAFTAKVTDIINTYDQKDIVSVKHKLRDLNSWCDKIVNNNESHVLRNFSKVVKHVIQAILNASNKTAFEKEKRKINFYLDAMKNAKQNISAAAARIKENMVKTPTFASQNLKSKNVGRSI